MISDYLRAGWILRVNLTEGTATREEVGTHADKFVGGKGINAKILFDGVEPSIKALDPENLLVFGAGPLTGTAFPGACRTDIMSKSPVTGAIGASSIGGYFGPELKFAGYDHLVIEGKAKTPAYLSIKNDEVEIRDASAIWGCDTFDTPMRVREELEEPGAQVVCIGPAGERLVLYASINTATGNVAARTGLGAVMGSKNLKAIAVRGTGGLQIARPKEFLEECKRLRDILAENRWYQKRHGLGEAATADADTATIYGLQGIMWERAESVNQMNFLKTYLYRTVGCFACPVACFQSYDIAGVGAGTVKCSAYSDLTWDLKNPDMMVFLKAYIMCQRYGLDSRSLANTVAWLMRLYEHGTITAEDTDNIPMTWGNPEAIISMARKISYREGIGDLLANGLPIAAKQIGRGAEDFLMLSKGSPIDTHIPPTKGTAISWATASTGEGLKRETGWDFLSLLKYGEAEDETSFVESITKYEAMARKEVGIEHAADPRFAQGKAALACSSEERYGVHDLAGVCTWMGGFMGLPVTPEMIADVMNLGLGCSVTVDTLVNAARRMRHVERAFEIKSGLTRDDDRLSKSFYRELRPGGKASPEISVTQGDLEKMKDDYYKLMGWDVATGVPTEETLVKFGLEDVADNLRFHGKIAT